MLGFGLTEFTDILNRLESKAIRVRPGQCTRLRHRLSTCTRCADVCPTGAICWENGLTVDSEKCTGCGACATVCPTGALSVRSPSLAELVESVTTTLKGRKPVVFACERYRAAHPERSDETIAVNCLAGLDESILVAAAAIGADKVWLLEGACDECPDSACRTVTEESVSRANRLLQALGHAGEVVLIDQLPWPAARDQDGGSAQGKLSRRGFFSLMSRQASRLGAVTADSVVARQGKGVKEETPKGALPTYVPEKRRLLLEGVRRANRRGDAGSIDGLSLWSKCTFTDACTGCQMCAFFCPTGALEKVEQDGKVGVAFRVAHCVDCRLCEEICYEKAVQLTDQMPISSLLDGSAEELNMLDIESAPWHDPNGERMKRSVTKLLGLDTES